MDVYDWLMIFLLAVLVLVLWVSWSYARDAAEYDAQMAESPEVNEQIALSGYVLKQDCPHGGHQGRDCPNWKKGKA